MNTALVIYEPGLDGVLFSRMGLLRELERQLRELEAEYTATVQRLRHFERRYKPAVGDRYEELDRLRTRVALAWEAVANARSGEARRATSSSNGDVADASASERLAEWSLGVLSAPSNSARLLFLSLARQVHPDLATDEDEHRRRHEVMSEATLAYRNNDERRLQWLIEHWQAQCEPIRASGLRPLWLKTNRQIAWIRYRIREMQHSIGQLHASAMAQLMERESEARSNGFNLILEMRQQVVADLEAAYRDLDRVRDAIKDLEPVTQQAISAECGL